jgi:hypothetical protein
VLIHRYSACVDRTSNHVKAALASRTRCERRHAELDVVARLLLPLLVCIGLVVLVLGLAPQTRAVDHSALAGPADAGPVVPSQLELDARDAGHTLAIVCETETENEDEDASTTVLAASVAALVSSDLRDPRRTAAAGARRPLVSNGLGRGPP